MIFLFSAVVERATLDDIDSTADDLLAARKIAPRDDAVVVILLK